MRLTSHPEPFDHPDWIYEVKFNGFRALAHSGPEGTRLVSRNLNVYKSFPGLCATLNANLQGRRAVVDGRSSVWDREGRPQFYGFCGAAQSSTSTRSM